MIADKIKHQFSTDIDYVRSYADNCWIVLAIFVEHVESNPKPVYNLYCIPIDSHYISYIIAWIVFRTPRHTFGKDG